MLAAGGQGGDDSGQGHRGEAPAKIFGHLGRASGIGEAGGQVKTVGGVKIKGFLIFCKPRFFPTSKPFQKIHPKLK